MTDLTARGFELPHPDNIAREDAGRVRRAIEQIDSDLSDIEGREASEAGHGNVRLATAAEAVAGTAADRVATVKRTKDMITAALSALEEALADQIADSEADLDAEIDNLQQAFTTQLQTLSTNTTTAIAQSQLQGPRVNLGANYTAVAADIGKTFNFTATCTLAFAAAATLKAGWFCFVRVTGANTLIGTLDPNGTETIDGGLTQNVFKGQEYMVMCDGAGFFSMGRPKEWLISSFETSASPLSYSMLATMPDLVDRFKVVVDRMRGTATQNILLASVFSADGATLRTGSGDYIYAVSDNNGGSFNVGQAVGGNMGGNYLLLQNTGGDQAGNTGYDAGQLLVHQIDPGSATRLASSNWSFGGSNASAMQVLNVSGMARFGGRIKGFGLYSPSDAFAARLSLYGSIIK